MSSAVWGGDDSYPAPCVTRRPMRTARTVGISRMARSNALTKARRSSTDRFARGFISTRCVIIGSSPPPPARPIVREADDLVRELGTELEAVDRRPISIDPWPERIRVWRDRRHGVDVGRAEGADRARHVNRGREQNDLFDTT